MPLEGAKFGLIRKISYTEPIVNMPSRPDVKHQSRDVAAVERANRSLERQNAKLKEDIKGLKKLLRLQKSVTKGRLFDPSSVDCIARYKGAAWS